MKNTSPMSKKEEYKYSTSIEGPDYGSAERSDDEDERELATEPDNNTNGLQVNSTRNKFSYSSTITTHEQKISNKVRKINDKIATSFVEHGENNIVSSSGEMRQIPNTMCYVVLFVVLLELTWKCDVVIMSVIYLVSFP